MLLTLKYYLISLKTKTIQNYCSNLFTINFLDGDTHQYINIVITCPQHGLVLGVYKDGDKYTLTEEANKFNERLGGQLRKLLQW